MEGIIDSYVEGIIDSYVPHRKIIDVFVTLNIELGESRLEQK